MVFLSELKVGEKAVVEKVVANGLFAVRLMDMGFTKGTPVTLLKVAPMGDPLQFLIRGYHITLRAADAQKIVVTK